jgi:hypothetical protein
MRVRIDPFTASETLVSYPKDGIKIVQEGRKLIVICAKCEAYIHTSGAGKKQKWKCSIDEHELMFTRELVDENEYAADDGMYLESSVCYTDYSTDIIRAWAAYWLIVDKKDVQVTKDEVV